MSGIDETIAAMKERAKRQKDPLQKLAQQASIAKLEWIAAIAGGNLESVKQLHRNWMKAEQSYRAVSKLKMLKFRTS